jgi:methylated-DNA-[protein]-cysteine S-methyltransferase
MTSPAPYVFAVTPPGVAGAVHLFKTRAGWAGVLARGDVLCRVFLPVASREEILEGLARSGVGAPAAPAPRELTPVVESVVSYFAGEAVDPAATAVRFDPGPISDFALRTYAALRTVKRGETTTYGELAAKAGRPGAARAVGVAMSKNRFPLLVPCHRVLAHGGRLGGFSSSRGLEDKKLMLGLERA